MSSGRGVGERYARMIDGEVEILQTEHGTFCFAEFGQALERLRGLHDKARENLRPMRIPNVHLIFGDGMEGYAKGAPYSAIIAAAGGEAVPEAWIDQLAMGGRIVAPMQTAAGQQALVVIDKTPQGIQQHMLEAVHFVPLKSGIA